MTRLCCLSNKSKFKSICLITILLSFLSPIPAYGTTGTVIVAGLIGDKILSEFLEEARQAVNKALADAKHFGDALMARAANELSVLIELAAINFGHSLDKPIKTLQEEHRKFLQAVYDSQKSIENFSRGVYEFKDSVVLDIREMTKYLVGEKYYIQRVDGLSQIVGLAEYRIVINGVGFGPDSEKHKSSLELMIDGKNIETFRVLKSQASQTVIYIQSSAFKPFLEKKKIAIVPLTIIMKTKDKKRFLVLGSKWEENSYKLPLWISIFPKLAGQIKVKYRLPIYGWVDDRIQTIYDTNPDMCHCSKNCSKWSGIGMSACTSVVGGNKKVPGYERVSRVVSWRCVSNLNACGFDRNLTTEISDNGKRVCGHWVCRTHHLRYQLRFQVQRYQIKNIEEIEWDPYDVEYNQVDISVMAKDAQDIIIEGKTITGKRITEVVGATTNNELFVVTDVKTDETGKRVVIRIKGPPGL